MTRRHNVIVGALAAMLAPATAMADVRPATSTVLMESRPADEYSRTLYLNRCAGGCPITFGGMNDARAGVSNIPMGGTNFTVDPWEYGDERWAELVTCVKEVYSPFNITVTEIRPTNETYNEAIVGGVPANIGWSGIGGVAPVTGDCSPYNNVISFTFSNIYGANNVLNICATVAQESGHAYGMDHEYEFLDGRSACTDPMTYRSDCGGQQFFRNDAARCGENAPRACRCTTTQNSHQHLLARLGSATPITSPPSVRLTSPAMNATISSNAVVVAIASAQRGVRRVELILNGYNWGEVEGVGFGQAGQPEAGYSLAIPAMVPDGVIDIQVIAKDDIDIATTSETVTVTKGAAACSATSCLLGQRCDERGRCLWDPAVGEFGDSCEYSQFCKNELCAGTAEEKICTTVCVVNTTDGCNDGFSCIPYEGQGVCFPADPEAGGCCSTNRDGAVQTTLFGMAMAMLLFRRRRKTR